MVFSCASDVVCKIANCKLQIASVNSTNTVTKNTKQLIKLHRLAGLSYTTLLNRHRGFLNRPSDFMIDHTDLIAQVI